MSGYLFAFGHQVSEACLPVLGVGGVVSGIGVSMENAGEIVAKEECGHIAATRGYDIVQGDFAGSAAPSVWP